VCLPPTQCAPHLSAAGEGELAATGCEGHMVPLQVQLGCVRAAPLHSSSGSLKWPCAECEGVPVRRRRRQHKSTASPSAPRLCGWWKVPQAARAHVLMELAAAGTWGSHSQRRVGTVCSTHFNMPLGRSWCHIGDWGIWPAAPGLFPPPARGAPTGCSHTIHSSCKTETTGCDGLLGCAGRSDWLLTQNLFPTYAGLNQQAAMAYSDAGLRLAYVPQDNMQAWWDAVRCRASPGLPNLLSSPYLA